MNIPSISQKNLLLALGCIGSVSVLVSGDFVSTAYLMVLAYLSNTSYSITSRSGTRNSALFHAVAVFTSSLMFYLVLRKLVTNNLNLALFVPYTVATVYGSLTGAKLSMGVERRFGITTSTDKPTTEEKQKQAKTARRALLSLLVILTVCLVVFSRDLPLRLVGIVIGAMFANDAIFSLLRRSRNSSSVGYHIAVSLVHSAVWYLLYKTLAEHRMSAELFWPYAYGSVLGNLFGQKISERIERLIGGSADKHVAMPWKAIVGLGVASAALLALTDNPLVVAGLVSFAVFQQISFSLVSRSRNRNNMFYHAIASIFSNGVWFLTFRQVNSVAKWSWDSYLPYATGSAMGSVVGVGISMGFEKKLNIKSDSPAPVKA